MIGRQEVRCVSELGQSRHFDGATTTSGLPPEQRTSSDRPGWSGSCHKPRRRV